MYLEIARNVVKSMFTPFLITKLNYLMTTNLISEGITDLKASDKLR